MKSKYLQIVIPAFLLLFTVQVSAQTGTDYITVSGEVSDAETKKKLEYVSVSVLNTNISTVTNEDGGFSIKVKKSLGAEAIVFTHLGYASQQLAIAGSSMQDVKITLHAVTYEIEGAFVGTDALALVKEAISRIPQNYSSKPNMLTGFYRETVKKRNSYINISEAITYTYKTSYDKRIDGDRVQVYKGRQLLSPKASDTLMVKLQGGPVASIYIDAVKGWDILTDQESLSYYKYYLAGSTMIDGRAHYAVTFRPQVVVPYALLYGTLYIDEQTLTISKVQANLDMSDENKAAAVILKKKPFGMYFKPESLSYEVTYKRHRDISYLNYVRSEIRFKCDWKRKLFTAGYLVVAEMVVTDVSDQDVARIPGKLTFGYQHTLSDKLNSFTDKNFWEDYNIIEPTESLESAANKLRKKLE